MRSFAQELSGEGVVARVSCIETTFPNGPVDCPTHNPESLFSSPALKLALENGRPVFEQGPLSRESCRCREGRTHC